MGAMSCMGPKMRIVLTGLVALAAAAAFAGPAAAVTTLDVSWQEGCGKSTCFNEAGVFTKTWSAADASGPMTIGRLLLDRGILGSFADKTFRLSFTLNGEELGAWGSFTMGGIAGDELLFNGQAFTWNPEDGDLVLVLALTPPPKAGAGGGFFSAANFDTGPETGDEPGLDLVDIPEPLREQALTAPVPEPSVWALMISGFGLAGAMLRRKPRVVAQMQPRR